MPRLFARRRARELAGSGSLGWANNCSHLLAHLRRWEQRVPRPGPRRRDFLGRDGEIGAPGEASTKLPEAPGGKFTAPGEPRHGAGASTHGCCGSAGFWRCRVGAGGVMGSVHNGIRGSDFGGRTSLGPGCRRGRWGGATQELEGMGTGSWGAPGCWGGLTQPTLTPQTPCPSRSCTTPPPGPSARPHRPYRRDVPWPF